MKRVIDGKSYNTDTSTIVARWDYADSDGYDTEAALYRTRGGAFFAVHEWEVQDREGDPRTKTFVEAMNLDEVQRLVERTDNLEIIDANVLADPPEAVAEETPGATLYLRMPASLKAQIEAAAAEDRLSANAFMTRCAEACIAGRKQPA